MPAWSAPTGRSASIPSSIAARRKSPAWCSASTAAAIAAASPTGWRRPSARPPSTICARASRSPWSIARPGARSGSTTTRNRACTRFATWWTAATGNMPAGSPLAQQLHYVRQGHGRSGACRDYVLAAVKELEAHGYRDDDLHRLAEQLKGTHEIRSGLTPRSRRRHCADLSSAAFRSGRLLGGIRCAVYRCLPRCWRSSRGTRRRPRRSAEDRSRGLLLAQQ